MRRRPAFDKAQRYLEEMIRRAGKDRTAAMRLPPIADMARDARVSRDTMMYAVQSFAGRGLLEATTRRGIIIPPAPEHAAPRRSPIRHEEKWEYAARRIGEMINEGEIPTAQSFPALGELAARIGVSYPVLKRSLRELTARKVLEPYKRTYRLVQPGHSRASGSVILFAVAETSGAIDPHTPRTLDLARALERECSAARLRLILAPFLFRRRRFDFSRLGADPFDGRRLGPVVGYMLWTTGLPPEETARLMHAMHATGKPAAVLDETGEGPVAEELLGSRRIRTFHCGHSAEPGRAMAAHLLELGHRRVAWFGVNPSARWAVNRLAGFRQAFAGRGISDAVAVLSVPGTRQKQSVRQERFAAKAWAFVRTLDRLAPRLPQYKINLIVSRLTAVEESEAVAGSLTPLCDKALGLSGVTAWVGENDLVALCLLEYLRARKHTDISVAGFDDTIEALSQGLTSYNFNADAVIRAMTGHLLRPRWTSRRFGAPDSPVEIPGFVVERESTRRVREASRATGRDQSSHHRPRPGSGLRST